MEASTRLEALVASRERQRVEFKRQLPKENGTIVKTVCAFANGEGGSLAIGVDDDWNIVGLDDRKADDVWESLVQMIGSWVEPRPSFDFQVLAVPDSDKVVVELVVEPGVELYGCGRPGEVRNVYARRHNVTEKAGLAEIAALVRSRPGARPVAPPFG